jgi:hypothetical protein
MAGFSTESQGVLALLAFADQRFSLAQERGASRCRAWTMVSPRDDQDAELNPRSGGSLGARRVTAPAWGGAVVLQPRERRWVIDLVATERSLRPSGRRPGLW